MKIQKTKQNILFCKFHTMFNYFQFVILFPFLLRMAFGSNNFNSNYVPTENISLDCGSSDLLSLSYDGRNWTNEVRSEFVSYHSVANSSFVSTAASMDRPVPEVPYKTARVFMSNFTYSFNLTAGSKFVRLHFYPSNSFPNLNFSASFMTVTSGEHSLLRNFSSLLTASYLNYAYFFREFIVQVESNTLDLTFSPSSNDPEAFAFVNGIEIVSMPEKLYIDSNKLLPHVGFPSMTISLDNVTALETVYRINVGGPDIAPKQDTGMFRTWTDDLPYFYGADLRQQPYDSDASIKYSPNVPAYTAPENVYKTSRSMGPDSQININYNLSWFFPVDTGFTYLVRLHFCQVDRSITKINQQVFDIYINNQTALTQDIVAMAEGYAVPIYTDYFVTNVPNDEGRQDLWLELHPNKWSSSEYYDASINGVEIFKISNYDGSLAGLNPSFIESPSASKPSLMKKLILIFGCLFGVVLLAVIPFSLVSCRLRKARQSLRQKPISEMSNRFSLNEIKAATKNFDEALVIGSGSFGVVYRGNIGGTTISVKRANQATTSQASYQYEAEITVLSKLRHHNIISLLGYCNEDNEMILVYEYMSNGTLFDHLHLHETLQKSPLTWNQRLDTCVGVARGLHYLQTGMNLPIIHRDIKTTNILIDSDWTAKVSDFGLSKLCKTAETNSSEDQGSMNIRGSVGYMDPEYYRSKTLTEKSDVYSFGVVLLEVISARQVLNPVADNVDDDEDQESFVEWALKCINMGDTYQLTDPHLRGKTKAASVAKFLEVARKCVEEKGRERPFMNEVVWGLELALFLQGSEDDDESDMLNNDFVNISDVMLGVEFSEIMVPLGR